ncbi:hypothetical protein D3C81_1342680 [compost metagenome]
MHDHCRRAGEIIGQVYRAQKWHLRAMGSRHIGNFGIVGADHDLIEQARFQRSADRTDNHRHAVERQKVLARDAFATATGRDDCNVAQGRFSNRNQVMSSTGNCGSR